MMSTNIEIRKKKKKHSQIQEMVMMKLTGFSDTEMRSRVTGWAQKPWRT